MTQKLRTWKDDTATPRQVEYITGLLSKKVDSGTENFQVTMECLNTLTTPKGQTLTKAYASRMIEKLKQMPNLPSPASNEKEKLGLQEKESTSHNKITEGMWRIGEDIYKVQLAVYGSGHLYAKMLKLVWADSKKPLSAEELEWFSDPDVAASYKKGGENEGQIKGKFIKVDGAITKLRKSPDAVKLTKEDAKVFGSLYGICMICGRLLTDETSIEQGIGPICVKKYF